MAPARRCRHFRACLVGAVGLAAAAVARPASAYEERLHALMTERVLAEDGPVLTPPTEEELAGFVEFVRGRLLTAAQVGSAEPRGASLLRELLAPGDSAALKRALMLNPAMSVHGLDRAEGGPATRREVLARASRWPDDDRRNQERFLRDAGGNPVRGPDGTPLPADPAILEMGAGTGTSSQAHAHYQLLPESVRSDDPEVLWGEPARFSMPKDAHTFGADFTEIYLDLAALARAFPSPGAAWLAAAFEGNAFHHLQDLCNQVHTVQVGHRGFFVDAQKEVWKRELRTLGGLLGPRLSLRQVGVRILSNHHLFLEDLFAVRVLRVEDAPGSPGRLEAERLLGALGERDELLEQRVGAAREGGVSFARAASAALVEVGSEEAVEVYGYARQLAAPRLSRWSGPDYSLRQDPAAADAYLRMREPQVSRLPEWRRFFHLQAAGLRRWGTVAQLYVAEPPIAPEEAAARLAALLAERAREIAERQAAFVPSADRPSRLNLPLLGSVAAVIVGVIFLFRLRRSRAPRA